jgi:haloalkane dehalogenase
MMEQTHLSTEPFATKKFIEINGRRMAYIDEGEGAAIVFQHGNPTSSYLWRNVMPACRGLGRLIACDMIGMGDSDKLPNSGPDRYTYAEQRSFLFPLWEKLGLGDQVVFVLHDWGSALGFEWASKNRERVQGIAYMEAIVMPLKWTDIPEASHNLFRGFRSPAGEEMVLVKNIFVENVLPASILRQLQPAEMAEYRRPFLNAGEDRRPTLTWPRQIPFEGEPPDVTKVVEAYASWLAGSPVPKLYIHGDPGILDNGRPREFCKTWPNQTEATVRGLHFVQEDSGPEIGAAVVAFVRRLRGA